VGGKPLNFKFKFEFPNDAIGRSKLEEFKAGLEKGRPTAVTAPYIAQAEIPEFLRPIVGQIEKLEFQLSPKTKPVRVTFRVDSDDGSSLCLDNIELRVERAGTKEALLSNRHQEL